MVRESARSSIALSVSDALETFQMYMEMVKRPGIYESRAPLNMIKLANIPPSYGYGGTSLRRNSLLLAP